MTGTVPVPAPPIPRNFVEYVRSFGPGIVIVLTWLGAGDVVDMSTAGANYGYSLLWVLAANSAQVVLLPMLAGGLWWITASERLIGPDYRNRWWENAVMAILFVLATYFAIQATRDLVSSPESSRNDLHRCSHPRGSSEEGQEIRSLQCS